MKRALQYCAMLVIVVLALLVQGGTSFRSFVYSLSVMDHLSQFEAFGASKLLAVLIVIVAPLFCGFLLGYVLYALGLRFIGGALQTKTSIVRSFAIGLLLLCSASGMYFVSDTYLHNALGYGNGLILAVLAYSAAVLIGTFIYGAGCLNTQSKGTADTNIMASRPRSMEASHDGP